MEHGIEPECEEDEEIIYRNSSEPQKPVIFDMREQPYTDKQKKTLANRNRRRYYPIPITEHIKLSIPLKPLLQGSIDDTIEIGILSTADGRVYFERGSSGGLLGLVYHKPFIILREYPDEKNQIILPVLLGAYDADTEGRITQIYISLEDALVMPYPNRGKNAEAKQKFAEIVQRDLVTVRDKMMDSRRRRTGES